MCVTFETGFAKNCCKFLFVICVLGHVLFILVHIHVLVQ